MRDNFYDFNHECDKMPSIMHGICRLKGSHTSQVTIEMSNCFGKFEATLYRFEFCPYCGVKLDDEE